MGTSFYRAPEIDLNGEYNGVSNDLFGIGVLLNAIACAQFACQTSGSNQPVDRHYLMVCQEDWDMFWAVKDPNNIRSWDLKALIWSLISLNPAHRLSMADVVAHPWLQGPTAPDEEVDAFLKQKEVPVELPKQMSTGRSSTNKKRGQVRYRSLEDENKLTALTPFKYDIEL